MHSNATMQHHLRHTSRKDVISFLIEQSLSKDFGATHSSSQFLTLLQELVPIRGSKCGHAGYRDIREYDIIQSLFNGLRCAIHQRQDYILVPLREFLDRRQRPKRMLSCGNSLL